MRGNVTETVCEDILAEHLPNLKNANNPQIQEFLQNSNQNQKKEIQGDIVKMQTTRENTT